MATQIDALASVYARSLFELADAAGGEEKIMEVNDEIEQIVDLSRRDSAFAEFLASPIIDKEKRGESLKRIFNGQVTDLMLRFMLVLNSKARLGHMEQIAAAHERMIQERFGRVEVDVFTAIALTPEQQQTISNRVQQALRREPVIHAYTDEDMIGGIKLRIGDQLIDGSVAGKLRRMRKSLLSTAGERIAERLHRIIEEDPRSTGDQTMQN